MPFGALSLQAKQIKMVPLKGDAELGLIAVNKIV